MSKENESRIGWLSWARFEAVDKTGEVWQFVEEPVFSPIDEEWSTRLVGNTRCEKVGNTGPQFDYGKTLIARYQKGATEPTRDLRETKDGPILHQPTQNQFAPGTNYIGPNDQPEKVIASPTLKDALVEHFGQITGRAEQHKDAEPATASENDYEETPFIPNRAEVWVRFMAAAITAGIADIDDSARWVDGIVAQYEKRFLNIQSTTK